MEVLSQGIFLTSASSGTILEQKKNAEFKQYTLESPGSV